MPAKYHIQSAPVAGRFQPITRSGVIAWEEGCLKCAKCVKKECVYKVYEKRALDDRQMIDSLDSVCQDCFRCVQNCPNRLISKELNPAYKAIGNSYWSPEILSNIWFQAETGRIPVSGAGTAVPFRDPVSMPCGPTCRRSSDPPGTGSTAANTSAPPSISAGR